MVRKDEEMQIQVSVVVPAYNREKTIKRCIDSIVTQTVPPMEILVVDDGSTDGTVHMLESMDCACLKIIKQNHKGAQAARNLGILNANGEYIAFLDSDDEWLPDMLEREIAYLVKEKGDCVIYGDCYTCRHGKKTLWNLPGRTGNLYDYLLIHPGPMFQSLLAKKELFLRIGLLDENVVAYQEWDTAIQLAREAKFIHMRRPLFNFYQHDGERISYNMDANIRGYSYIVKKYQKEIMERHGIKGINLHYSLLVRECVKYKNRQIGNMIFRWIAIYTKYLLQLSKEMCWKYADYKKER